MSDPIAAVEADAKTAELAVATLVSPAVTDIKTLLATRAGDMVIAGIALGGVFIGHLLH